MTIGFGDFVHILWQRFRDSVYKMERSTTGDEFGAVSRDNGKRMLSVEQPEVHSNSKFCNSNPEPKHNYRSSQTLRLIAVALIFQLVLIYWVAPRASIKWPNFRMLFSHSTEPSSTSHNSQPVVHLGNNFNWTEVSIRPLTETLFILIMQFETYSTYQQSNRTGQTATMGYSACNSNAPDSA